MSDAALDRVAGEDLAAHHVLGVEVTSAIRRQVRGGRLTVDHARLALQDMAALDVARFPFEPFLGRAWEVRENVTPYDAWYVALAEELEPPLLTLDRRLASASGPRCSFELLGDDAAAPT